MRPRIALIGASGYTGIELTRLILGHSGVELVAASSDRWIGDTIEQRTAAPSQLRYVSLDDGLSLAAACDIVLLATPAEASHELAPKLLAHRARVIDLSGAYRLRDGELYPQFYGFRHAHPALLAEAVYGLPELFRKRL